MVKFFILYIQMKQSISLVVAMFLIVSNIDAQTTISLNAKDEGRVFEGIGAVSAGASSRNLIDYPDKQRSEVLDVLLAGGDAEIGGRYADRDKLGFRLILTRDGRWQLNWQYTTLASGQIENFKPSEWHHLRLEMMGDKITCLVDDKKLASVSDKSGLKGMAFIASTYDRNLFDNIRVVSAEPDRSLKE